MCLSSCSIWKFHIFSRDMRDHRQRYEVSCGNALFPHNNSQTLREEVRACAHVCVCLDISSAADRRSVWRCSGATRHVDEPVFTDSATWNVYPLSADDLRWASSPRPPREKRLGGNRIPQRLQFKSWPVFAMPSNTRARIEKDKRATDLGSFFLGMPWKYFTEIWCETLFRSQFESQQLHVLEPFIEMYNTVSSLEPAFCWFPPNFRVVLIPLSAFANRLRDIKATEFTQMKRCAGGSNLSALTATTRSLSQLLRPASQSGKKTGAQMDRNLERHPQHVRARVLSAEVYYRKKTKRISRPCVVPVSFLCPVYLSACFVHTFWAWTVYPKFLL